MQFREGRVFHIGNRRTRGYNPWPGFVPNPGKQIVIEIKAGACHTGRVGVWIGEE
jgi:hypothetical protein